MIEAVETTRGIWLDERLDADLAHEVGAVCDVVEGRLADAFLALLMFEQALAAEHSEDPRARWDRDRQLDLECRADVELTHPQLPGETSFGYADRARELAQREAVRRRWAQGELPRSLAHRLPFLHARTFIASLAQLSRGLKQLVSMDAASTGAAVAAALSHLDAAAPGLKEIRDSVEHAEDRMRGRDRHGEELDLAPIMNSMIHAPDGGALVGDALNGRCYGCTLDDGTYAEVEISEDTLRAARDAAQEAFDALPWRDGARLSRPSL